MELIRNRMKELIGKNIIIFFKYSAVDYNIKKSGKVLECDEKHFVLDEVQDGKSIYAYDFIVQIMEDKA